MWKKRFAFLGSKPIRVIVIIIGVFFIFFGWSIWNNAEAQRQNEYNPTSGQLTAIYKIDPTQPIYVYLGGAGNNFTAQELSDGIDLNRLIEFGNFTFPIQITFGQDGDVQVSALIKDENGNILADIVDNQWKAPSSSGMQIWDKNYNSYAFEVIDANKIPILQVIIGAKNEVLVGISLYHEGIPYFGTIMTGFNLYGDYYTNGLTPSELEALRNATIFYYPSSQHLGQLKTIPDFSTFPPTFQSFPESNPSKPSTWNLIIGATMALSGGTIDAFVTYDTVEKSRNKAKGKRKGETPKKGKTKKK
jgi:hypothetical protein